MVCPLTAGMLARQQPPIKRVNHEPTPVKKAQATDVLMPSLCAQVVSPIAESTEDASDGGSNEKRTREQQQMQEESDYEPTAVKKAQARTLVKHVGKSRAAAKAAVIVEPEEDGAAAADEEKPRGTKVSDHMLCWKVHAMLFLA
jgi:hypothetical protein